MNEYISARPNATLLSTLTALRFFAALHVVFYHLYSNGYFIINIDTEASATYLYIQQIVIRYIQTGYISVSLFFVLSGFILIHSNRDRKFHNRNDYVEFYISRFSRIYPVYFLGLIAISPLILELTFSGQKTLGNTGIGFLLNLFLLQSWVAPAAMSWNTPGWSLSVELLFYAVFPFLATSLGRMKRNKLLIVTAGIFLIGILIPTVYVLTHPDQLLSSQLPHAYYSQAPVLVALKFFPIARIHEFVLGVTAGILFTRSNPTYRDGNLKAIVACTIALLAVPNILSDEFYPLLHNGAAAPIFALLILSLAKSKLNDYIKSNGILDILGKSSFALYIIHGPILLTMKSNMFALNYEHNSILTIFTLILSILISIIIFKYFEEPLRILLKHTLSRYFHRVK